MTSKSMFRILTNKFSRIQINWDIPKTQLSSKEIKISFKAFRLRNQVNKCRKIVYKKLII